MFKNVTLKLEGEPQAFKQEQRNTTSHWGCLHGQVKSEGHSKKSVKVVHLPNGGTMSGHVWCLLLPPYLIAYQGFIIFLLVDFSSHTFSSIITSITVVRFPDSSELLKPSWNIIPSNTHPTPSLIFIKHWYHDGVYILKLAQVPYFVLQRIRSRYLCPDSMAQGNLPPSLFSLSSNNQPHFLLLCSMLVLKLVSVESYPLAQFCDVCFWNKISPDKAHLETSPFSF